MTKSQGIRSKNTVFKTPNGLDAQGHQSTAYDLAVITRYAMKNPKFVKLLIQNTLQFLKRSNYKSYDLKIQTVFIRISWS